jgi:hypothetical protein
MQKNRGRPVGQPMGQNRSRRSTQSVVDLISTVRYREASKRKQAGQRRKLGWRKNVIDIRSP